MSVYVDPPAHLYRGQLYCHVWADSVEELHLAAQAAGLKREWFQQPPKANWCHYDCAPRIRGLLVKAGAIETDKYGPLEWLARQRGDEAKVEQIAALRAQWNAQAGQGSLL